MDYLVTFVEGIITFISPCLLPMLPIYFSYFAGGHGEEENKNKSLLNALAFVGGFTIIFVIMGVFAGSIGSFFIRNQRIINIVLGTFVIFFGLQYIGIFRALINPSSRKVGFSPHQGMSLGKSFLFGMIIFISWTPCTGPLLGAALVQASQSATALKGSLLLLSYSLGLGIPFMLSALLLDKLQGLFNFIKKHYQIIKIISGIFLVLIGVLMITGNFTALMQKISGGLS